MSRTRILLDSIESTNSDSAHRAAINWSQSRRRFFARKYWFDQFFGTLLLFVFSPAIVVLWLLVKVTSKGPGFYRQTRTGINRREFEIFKLRSMKIDAESNGQAVWCSPSDNRVTKIGNILRCLHLDELPQLLNVARGDMALVGPRPERPSICSSLEKNIAGYYDRVSTKPGITGLSQINLEADQTLEDVRRKQVLDIYYINQTNCWLEIRILFATALRLFGIKGELVIKWMQLCRRSLVFGETSSDAKTPLANCAVSLATHDSQQNLKAPSPTLITELEEKMSVHRSHKSHSSHQLGGAFPHFGQTPLEIHSPPVSGSQNNHSNDTSPRLLILTHRFPFPPNRGDRIRTYNVLSELSQKFSITLGSLTDEPVTDSQLEHIESLCDEVFVVESGRFSRLWGAARSLLRRTSVTESTFWSSSLAKKVNQAHQSNSFDCALVFCSSMFSYVNRPEFENTGTVVDLIDVDSYKWKQMHQEAIFPKSLVYGREARKVKRVEQQIADTADAICLVSNEEADLFRSIVQAPADKTIAGISNGVDAKFFKPAKAKTYKANDEPFRLVFTGVMNYAPNVEAVVWFCQAILPKLQKSIDVQFDIVGKNPNAVVKKLNQLKGVNVIGAVPDVRPYLSSADVSIAPLKLARGIQNKVLEAMAMQIPVVCTPQAAEGIAAIDGKHLLTSQTADQWHNELVSLAADRDLRTRLAAAGRELMVQSYSWSARLSPMVQLLSSLCPNESPAVETAEEDLVAPAASFPISALAGSHQTWPAQSTSTETTTQ